MRSSTSAHPQRLLLGLFAGLLSLGLLIPLAHADDELRDKRKRVQQEIEQTHDDLGEASKTVTRTTRKALRARQRLTAARTHLKEVRADLVAAQLRDAQMQAELTTAKTELATATAALKAGRLALQEQREQVRSTVTGNITRGDPRLQAFSSYIDSRSPEELIRRMASETAIVGHQSSVYDDLGEAEKELISQRATVKAAKEKVATKRTAAADHLSTVTSLFTQARDARVRVDTLLVSTKEARQAAVRAREADRVKLRRLEAREAKIRQRILAAARKAGGGNYQGVTGGLLDLPTTGSITSPYGYRTHPIFGYRAMHNGTDFGVACGQGLVASADGVVVGRYYDEIFGNRLFLSIGNVNGANITLVYNHLSGYKATKGDNVRRGTVVAYAGTTGWSTGCHLHFTVLRNGEPVDPMGYL